MNSKRGQLTLYILLGIVFIIVFGFLFFIVVFKQQGISSANVERATADLSKSVALQNYMMSCLERVSEDALVSIGNHGSFYNDDLQERDYLKFFAKNVSYGVVEPIYRESFPPFIVPAYPVSGNIPSVSFPYYGRDVLANLCSVHGTGSLQRTRLQRPCSSYSGTDSIEQQLQQRVRTNISQCVKLENLDTLLPHEFTITQPEVNVTLGAAAVRFDVDFGITLNFGKHHEESVLRLTLSQPVRLKALHELAKEIIDKEIKDVYFSVDTMARLPTFQSGFEINRFSNICPECPGRSQDDIIVLRDKRSLVGGTPYTLQFAVQNRIPVLDYIHKTPIDEEFDYIVQVGDTIFIAPVGVDPDDDELTYTYSGWRSTEFLSSAEYRATEQNASYVPIAEDVHIDDGKHGVTVTVTDPAGKQDYQLVRVKVVDIPYFRISGRTPYLVVTNPYLLSIEDPYSLRIDVSCSACVVNSIQWNIYHRLFPNNPYFSIPTTRKEIELVTDPDIRTIRNLPVNTNDDGIYARVGTENLATLRLEYEDLKVVSCLPLASEEEIFPYNRADPDSMDAFLGSHTCCMGDPRFYDAATEIALPSWGEFASPSTICQQQEGNICSPQLETFSVTPVQLFRSNNGELQEAVSPSDANVYTFETQNDIYFRKFQQHCSGDRGNVCAGDIVYEAPTVVDSCSDLSGDEDERCEGPCVNCNVDNCFGIEGGLPNSCFPYPSGQTFEKTFLLDSRNGGADALPAAQRDGFCNNVPKRSNALQGVESYDTVDGKYECLGTCDGRGTCSWAAECVCKYDVGVCENVAPDSCDTSRRIYCGSTCNQEQPSDSEAACRCSDPIRARYISACQRWGSPKFGGSFCEISAAHEDKCAPGQLTTTPSGNLYCREFAPPYNQNLCEIL